MKIFNGSSSRSSWWGDLGGFRAGNADHAFAALASRISLDTCMNQGGTSMAQRAVNSYLRLFLTGDMRTGYLKTATPSEPIVADVLARVLLQQFDLHMSNWSMVIRTSINELLSRRLVDKGVCGEIFSMMVMILARDYFLRNSLPLELELCPHFFFSKPFSLERYLTSLFSKDFLPEYLNCAHRPGKMTRTQFRTTIFKMA